MRVRLLVLLISVFFGANAISAPKAKPRKPIKKISASKKRAHYEQDDEEEVHPGNRMKLMLRAPIATSDGYVQLESNGVSNETGKNHYIGLGLEFEAPIIAGFVVGGNYHSNFGVGVKEQTLRHHDVGAFAKYQFLFGDAHDASLLYLKVPLGLSLMELDQESWAITNTKADLGIGLNTGLSIGGFWFVGNHFVYGLELGYLYRYINMDAEQAGVKFENKYEFHQMNTSFALGYVF